MQRFRRRALTLALTVGALAGCAPDAPPTTLPPSPSASPADPGASATPTWPSATPTAPDSVAPSGSAEASTDPSASLLRGPLTEPGAAERVVSLLMEHGGRHPAVKVDITADQASVTLLLPDRQVRTYQWQVGAVSQVDSDVQDIDQQTFDPLIFNLSDVGDLFRTAVALGGSSSRQELQIVEYNNGQVLMTVTTRPESATVFFRPDATPINQLTFDTVADLSEAMRDTVNGHPLVYAMGLTPQQGFWCDYAGNEEGTIVRATRHAKLPVYMATRREAAPKPFASSQVSPSAIEEVLDRLHSEFGVHARDLTLTINMSDQRSTPTMRFTFQNKVVVTDLNGYDITDWIN